MIVETLEKYIKLVAEEGYITNYDGSDILNYSYAKVVYAPLNEDISTYREITEEENLKYIEEQEEILKNL